jgi:hypothetical protein
VAENFAQGTAILGSIGPQSWPNLLIQISILNPAAMCQHQSAVRTVFDRFQSQT